MVNDNNGRTVKDEIYEFLENRYPGHDYADVYAKYMGLKPLEVLEKWALPFSVDEELLHLIGVDIHEIAEALEILKIGGRITPIHEGKHWYKYYVQTHPIAADVEMSYLAQYSPEVGPDLVNEVMRRRSPKPWEYFSAKGLKPFNGEPDTNIRYERPVVRTAMSLIWDTR